jgi:glycosyltransferase involved in cell wall biosynthesis
MDKKKGYDVTILCSGHVTKKWPKTVTKGLQEGETAYGYIKIIKSVMFADKAFPVKLLEMIKTIRYGNYDVFHISGLNGFFTWISLAAIPAGKRVVINDHSSPATVRNGNLANFYYKISKQILKIFVYHDIRVVVPNEATANLIKKRYGLYRIFVIPLGYDSNIFTPLQNVTKKKVLNVGFVGKVEPRKNIEILINAMSKVTRDYHLKIVGISNTDYCRKLYRLAEELGIVVDFVPLVLERKELNEIYNSLDLTVAPGTISIGTVEANGSGCRVAIYNSQEGIGYRVENGRGFVYETLNELVELIEKVKPVDEHERLRISNATKSSVSWDAIHEEYLKLYI